MDWTSVRALFPAVRERVYLNTATYGPGPDPVRAAVDRANAEWSEGRGDWQAWERAGERARAAFARWIGARAQDVGLVPAVSVAAAQVAERLPLRPGANVVAGALEFRSNLYPWLQTEARGAEVRVVPSRDGLLPFEDLLDAVDDRTAVVAVSGVQSSQGQRLDLERLSERCRRHGARLFVDGTQQVGALRLPLELVDYLAVASYKWLLGPRGTGFLYVAPERVEELAPLAPGWRTPDDPRGVYYGPPLDVPATAERFDVSLAWQAWVGLDAAFDLLEPLGPENVERRDLELADAFRAGLTDLGLTPIVPADQASQIVALRVPDAQALERQLGEAGVVAAVRDGFLRLSFHFFNDESDVQAALTALAAV